MFKPILAGALAITALSACTSYGYGRYWERPYGSDRYYNYGGQRYAFAQRPGGYYYNDNYGYYHPRYGWWEQGRDCWRDPRWNPPGPRGGPGSNWATPHGNARCR